MTTLNSLPPFYDPTKVGEVWRVPYNERATEAMTWAKRNKIIPSAKDKVKVALMLIDVQNTFCIPDYELFVGGRSGNGAVDDNKRLSEFIYGNTSRISQIFATMDTHRVYQIFHPAFWINDKGQNPAPYTLITQDDVVNGVWKVNPTASSVAKGNYILLQQHALHYVNRLTEGGRYALTIWPYHALLGGIGHALVSSIEEACFVHSITRGVLTGHEIKGGNPLTENYSVLQPEVLDGPLIDPQDPSKGRMIIGQRNTDFIQKLLSFDMVVIAGQAKSHCVAWTISDLLSGIAVQDPALAKKVYLLEDCTSPVVVPGVIDYTEQADEAFARFAGAGMHVVKSTDPIENWPDVKF